LQGSDRTQADQKASGQRSRTFFARQVVVIVRLAAVHRTARFCEPPLNELIVAPEECRDVIGSHAVTDAGNRQKFARHNQMRSQERVVAGAGRPVSIILLIGKQLIHGA
jgi:hypothetical protein